MPLTSKLWTAPRQGLAATGRLSVCAERTPVPRMSAVCHSCLPLVEGGRTSGRLTSFYTEPPDFPLRGVAQGGRVDALVARGVELGGHLGILDDERLALAQPIMAAERTPTSPCAVFHACNPRVLCRASGCCTLFSTEPPHFLVRAVGQSAYVDALVARGVKLDSNLGKLGDKSLALAQPMAERTSAACCASSDECHPLVHRRASGRFTSFSTEPPHSLARAVGQGAHVEALVARGMKLGSHLGENGDERHCMPECLWGEEGSKKATSATNDTETSWCTFRRLVLNVIDRGLCAVKTPRSY